MIDSDPHFTRVIRYMRPSDLAWWGGLTAFAPLSLMSWESIQSSGSKRAALRETYRLSTALGLTAGFLMAYQRSSLRFFGRKENAREVEMDLRELGSRARAGKPLYGEADLDDFAQLIAAGNSTFSQFKLETIPWFNLANHKHHGVDTAKYYDWAKQNPA